MEVKCEPQRYNERFVISRMKSKQQRVIAKFYLMASRVLTKKKLYSILKRQIWGHRFDYHRLKYFICLHRSRYEQGSLSFDCVLRLPYALF